MEFYIIFYVYFMYIFCAGKETRNVIKFEIVGLTLKCQRFIQSGTDKFILTVTDLPWAKTLPLYLLRSWMYILPYIRDTFL